MTQFLCTALELMILLPGMLVAYLYRTQNGCANTILCLLLSIDEK